MSILAGITRTVGPLFSFTHKVAIAYLAKWKSITRSLIMRILSSSTLFAVSASMSLSVAIADDPTKKDMADFKIYSEIKWRDGPPSLPKGAMMAVLEGDPTKEGPFVFRIKV